MQWKYDKIDGRSIFLFFPLQSSLLQIKQFTQYE